MFRTHTCGELRLSDAGTKVSLSGWVQTTRDFGALTFIDLRDRYGITQLVIDADADKSLGEEAAKLGREWVIMAKGQVRERTNKNPNRATGDVEIEVSELTVLNASKVPPFTIEEESDGGDDLRMQY
ncbi:MAG: OB-fold nucleic acid binding domain-containing protein, partial [Bacteroidota bacterium]